jgi:hypothetical protein
MIARKAVFGPADENFSGNSPASDVAAPVSADLVSAKIHG